VREVNWRPVSASKRLDYFRLWLGLFSILNAVDMAQTWLFFEYETNPLLVQFPNVIFPVKIFWTFLAPAALYICFRKRPQVVYYASFALVLIYLAVVSANSVNIMRAMHVL
jgi:hypothetical protein